VSGRIKSITNSNYRNGNRTRDLPACIAVSQPTAPSRALIFSLLLYIKSRPFSENRQSTIWMNRNLLNFGRHAYDLHVFKDERMHASTYACMYTCMSIYVCMNALYTYIHVCMCMNIRIFICIYIRKCICIQDMYVSQYGRCTYISLCKVMRMCVCVCVRACARCCPNIFHCTSV
jgi:hypothetical protein